MSTGQLQLASLQFCMACRSVPRMHLRVELGTPRHLWVAATRLRTRNEMQPITARVPAFRPRKVTWDIQAATLDAASDPLASVECIKFGESFDGSFDGIVWPRNIKQIKFDVYSSNMSIDMVRWPQSLQQLRFGHYFNRPIDMVQWPSSLLQLTEVWLRLQSAYCRSHVAIVSSMDTTRVVIQLAYRQGNVAILSSAARTWLAFQPSYR